MTITLMTSGTAKAWADEYSCTHPVVELTDPVATAYWSNFVGYPSGKMMKPGLVVQNPDIHPAEITAAHIEAILP